MDLRWLAAPDAEVVAAIADVRAESRPSWAPTWRQVLFHVNNCLLLWVMAISWFVLSVRIDTLQDNEITPTDIRDMTIVVLVLLGWGGATYALYLWSRRPSSPRTRIAQWREQLTGTANGFASHPTQRNTFRSLITAGDARSAFHPRFTRKNVEFGQLARGRPYKAQWFYLAVKLPVPVPHLLLRSQKAGGLEKQLLVRLAESQRLPLEGDFDSWFHAYVPGGYERDALFVLVPDVMAALVDHASEFHVELLDDRVVFFAPGRRRFTDAETWQALDALRWGALPPLVRAAVRYRDERVPGQNSSAAVASILASLQASDAHWDEPLRTVGARGRRLKLRDFRSGWWGILGLAGWGLSLTFLYVVPAVFLFAAVMAIVDGH